MAAIAAVRTRSELEAALRSRGIPFETIQDGPRWVVAAPALAARIMGAGVGEENAFWVPPVDGWEPGGWNTRGWNAGGQRTWIAPEGGPSGFFFSPDGSTWSVPPELDPGSYGPAKAEPGWRAWQTELTSRTAAGSARRLRIRRGVRMEEAAGSPHVMVLRFRHTLENLDDSPLDRQVGLWGLIQLPCDEPGSIFLSLRRQDAVLRPCFGEVPRIRRGDDGKAAWLTVRGGTRFKAGISPRDFAGTVGFVRRSRLAGGNRRLMLTAMTFETDPGGTYVDRSLSVRTGSVNGDAAQVYGDPGTGALAFCEIEAHAPAPRLEPGASKAQDIAITIASLEEEELGGFLHRRMDTRLPPAARQAEVGRYPFSPVIAIPWTKYLDRKM